MTEQQAEAGQYHANTREPNGEERRIGLAPELPELNALAVAVSPLRPSETTAAGGRYSTVAICLHWAIASAIVLQLMLGWRLQDAEGGLQSAILHLHVSLGITILLLSVARIGWRIGHKPPAEPDLTRFERHLSRWVHQSFYAALLVLPLTGWAMGSANRGKGFLLFGALPWPRFPLVGHLPPALQDGIASALDTGHLWAAWLMLALFGLHVAGALKHHFLSTHRVLPRMLPGTKTGALIEPRLIALALALLAFGSAAYLVKARVTVVRSVPTSIGEADIFLDIVQPALQRRCASCHSEDRSRGALSVSSYEDLLRGGKSGSAIVPGSPQKSEIYKRITLPRHDPKYMPQNDRTSLTANQVAAIKWWISIGAPASGKVAALRPATATQQLLTKVLHLSGSEDSEAGGGAIETLPQVVPGDAAAITALESAGFTVRPTAKDSNLLDINLYEVRSLTDRDIANLGSLQLQLRSLEIRSAGVRDSQLQTIATMHRLVLLDLPNNPITDSGAAKLADLKGLRALDLHGTKVTDAVLATLSLLPRLERVYLWNTAVTSAGVKQFRASHSHVDISLDEGTLIEAAAIVAPAKATPKR